MTARGFSKLLQPNLLQPVGVDPPAPCAVSEARCDRSTCWDAHAGMQTVSQRVCALHWSVSPGAASVQIGVGSIVQRCAGFDRAGLCRDCGEPGRDRGQATLPELLDERSKRPSHLPALAQPVLLVYVPQVGAGQEGLEEGHGVREALQAAVHEAGVAQVGEASQAGLPACRQHTSIGSKASVPSLLTMHPHVVEPASGCCAGRTGPRDRPAGARGR